MGTGAKIVLAASDSESSEYDRSTWRQMLYATIPAGYARYMAEMSTHNQVAADGQAVHVPHGLRIVESLLVGHFAPQDVKVCYADQLPRFVGENTRVVGIHAHNPLGITFATDVYSRMFGAHMEPLNAVYFRKLIEHPMLRQHKRHLKIIVGGPGAWQIAKKQMEHNGTSTALSTVKRRTSFYVCSNWQRMVTLYLAK